MPVYPRRRDEPRALARELAGLHRRLDAAARSSSTAADNVPPPVDVAPDPLVAFEIQAGQPEETP